MAAAAAFLILPRLDRSGDERKSLYRMLYDRNIGGAFATQGDADAAFCKIPPDYRAAFEVSSVEDGLMRY